MTAEARERRWNLNEKHFKWRNAHVKPSIGYRLWFYNLRLSRDYYMAHKEAKRQLKYNEAFALPSDFDLVRKTYSLAGDVWSGLFEDWWLKRGRDLFAIAGPDVRADVILRVPPAQSIDANLLSREIERYQSEVLNSLEYPETLLVGVPLTGNKTEILEAFGKMLDGYQAIPKPQTTLRFNNKIIQQQALKNYLDLLWIRINEPYLHHWEVCMNIGLSGKARALKAEGKTPDKSLQEEMASISSTMNLKARLISESAARGSFPTPLNLDLVAESKEELCERIGLILKCYEIETRQLGDAEFQAAVREFY